MKNIVLVLYSFVVLLGSTRNSYGNSPIPQKDTIIINNDSIYEFINVKRTKKMDQYGKELLNNFPVLFGNKFRDICFNSYYNNKPLLKEIDFPDVDIQNVAYGMRGKDFCLLICDYYNQDYVLFWKQNADKFIPNFPFSDNVNFIQDIKVTQLNGNIYLETYCSYGAFGEEYITYYILELDASHNLNLLFEEGSKASSTKYKIAIENNKIVLHSEKDKSKKKSGNIKKTYELINNKFIEVK